MNGPQAPVSRSQSNTRVDTGRGRLSRLRLPDPLPPIGVAFRPATLRPRVDPVPITRAHV